MAETKSFTIYSYWLELAWRGCKREGDKFGNHKAVYNMDIIFLEKIMGCHFNSGQLKKEHENFLELVLSHMLTLYKFVHIILVFYNKNVN